MRFKLILSLSTFLFLSGLTLQAQTITAVTGSYCVGSQTVFNLTGSLCSSYSWSVSSGVNGVDYYITGSNTSSAFQVTWLNAISSNVRCSYVCSSTSSSAYSSNFTIAVKVAPSVNITANPATTVCQTSNVTFTATPTNGGTSPYFNWQVNGTTISGGSSNTFTRSSFANGDIVRVILTSNYVCVTSSTATSNSIVMSVTPPTPVSVSVTGPTTICNGGSTSASFAATITNGGSSPVFTWYKNGNPVSDRMSGPPPYIYISINPLNNGDKIKCQVASNGTCPSVNPAVSNEYTVSLTNAISPSVGVQLTKINYCSGETMSLSASSSYITGSSTYSWKLNGTQFATTNATSLIITNDINLPNAFSPGDVVTVAVTGLSGICLSSTTATGTTLGIPITISNPAPPTVSIVKNNPSYCTGETIIFSVLTNSVTSRATYIWNLNGTQISTSSTASLLTSLDPNASSNLFKPGSVITVQVSELSGYCLSGATATTSLSASSVSIYPYPDIPYLFLPNPPVTIKVNSGWHYLAAKFKTGTIESSILQWRKDGVNIQGATGSNAGEITSEGIYDLVVTQNGCTKTSPPVPITINLWPTLTHIPDISAFVGMPVLIHTDAYDPDGFIYYYDWTRYGVVTPGDPGSLRSHSPDYWFIPRTPGTTTFALSVADDCQCHPTNPNIEDRGKANDTNIRVTAVVSPNNFNSIKETQVLVKGKLNEEEVNLLMIPNGEKHVTWNYYDGLGRTLQIVSQQGSPSKNDVVTPKAYDSYGREARIYLPIVMAETNGYYKSNANLIDNITGSYKGVAADFYSVGSDNKIADDARPFSETTYETSPLNRTSKEFGIGKDWFDNNKAITQQYPANTHGLGSTLSEEKIILWKLNNKLPERNLFVNSGYYPNGSLLIKSVKDEQGNEVREYTDRLGRIVLRKLQVKAPISSLNDLEQWALTYYIYDDFGSLVFVLQPELSKSLQNSNTYNPTTIDLHNYAFQYTFDERKRMVVKKVPGVDSIFMIYDNRNRLVLTQNGNQRKDTNGVVNKTEWSFIKYDILNRPIITGVYVHGSIVNRKVMISNISTVNFVESYNGIPATHGYTNSVFPTMNLQILSVTYYDNYKFKTDMAGAKYDYTTNDITNQEAAANSNVKGYTTSTKINILGTSNYLWSAIYFDQKYRVIQTKNQNHKGGIDRVTNLYDFVNLKETKSFHTNGSATYSAHRKYDYDHAKRLTKTWHKFHTESTFVLLQENIYNELGQLVTEKLHSRDNGVTSAQNTDYLYNIRGWLESINNPVVPEASDLFSMGLKYNTPSASGGEPMYNGNISEQAWKSVGLDRQAYCYKYDPMNRLLEANYVNQIRPLNNGRYTEIIYNKSKSPYDLNGNINGLVRYGKRSAGVFGLTDRLDYKTYTGNQLTSVDDTEEEFGFDDGFKDAIETTNEYVYDWNGNMIKDQNKGITSIIYNYLNLPVQVNKGITDYIVYTYDAAGRKLTQKVFGTSPKTTEYLGEYIYENTSGTDVLQFITHERGRIVPDNSAGAPRPWEYQYFLKDHLGNVRVTFSEKNVATEFNAGMEGASPSAQEQSWFKNYSRNGPPLYNHTPGGAYSQLLTGGYNRKIGLAKSVSVNVGDILDLEVYAKYESPTTTSADPTSLLSALLTAFNISAVGLSPIEGPLANSAFNSLFGAGSIIGKGSNPYEDATAPRAYLNYILFDENFVMKDFGFDQISLNAKQVGLTPVVPHDYFNLHVKVRQKGYLYIYLSNEQTVQTNVYFDDLKITYNSGVEQVAEYYPFGLTYNSYSRENSVPNKIKFQGQEHVDDLGLNWDSFKWRNHQPDIGRFFNVDPLADNYVYNSPYAFSENQVVAHRELEGLEKSAVNEEILGNTTTINRDGSTIQVGSVDGGGNTVCSATIQLPSKNTQEEITDKGARVIGEIAMAANEPEITVSRVKTTEVKQADAMYNNIVGKGKGQGLSRQRDLYKNQPGAMVVESFVRSRALQGLASQFGGNVTKGQIKGMMVSTIFKIGLGSVTNHAQTNPKLNNTIDVSPKSIPEVNQPAFVEAAQGHPDVKRIIPPPKDPAYHIEVKQN